MYLAVPSISTRNAQKEEGWESGKQPVNLIVLNAYIKSQNGIQL